MFESLFAIGLLNRRKKEEPVAVEQRKTPTRKEATDKLADSIENLKNTVARAVERSEDA